MKALPQSVKRKVLIIYKFMPQWRANFFSLLRDKLASQGIELTLVYGRLKNEHATRGDEVDLDWARFIPNKTLRVGKIELYWQPCLSDVLKNDLIIVEQANKLLINYFLMMLRLVTDKKIAFWGHGLNLLEHGNSYGNRLKRLYSTKCDWWFAYTEGVKERIASMGFPKEKVTVVQNAIDTSSLVKAYEMISEGELSPIKSQLNIGNGPIGIYCGGMYKEKRLDFLLQSAAFIRDKVPEFEMIFLGAGPEEYKVRNISLQNKWIHYVGPKFGLDRVPYFRMADVFLMPGAVGLAILDSFSMQTPLITTCSSHSPEIEYLRNGYNGVMTDNTLTDYVNTVVSVLGSENRMETLRNGCRQDAEKYTLEKMVDNFYKGILQSFTRQKHSIND